jgi:GAF domain-containing protein/DNA-binding NarL/FixJ family response regulator
MTGDPSPEQADLYQPVVKQGLIQYLEQVAHAKIQAPGSVDPHNIALAWEETLLKQALEELHAQKEQQAQTIAREKVLAQVIDRICQTLNIAEVFKTATAEIRQLLHADRVAIYRFTATTGDFAGEFVAEDTAPEYLSVLTEDSQDLGLGKYYGVLYKSGDPLAIADIYAENFSVSYLQTLLHFKVYAFLVIPLIHQQRLWGLLCIHQCCGTRQWQPVEVDFAFRIALQLSVALQQSELHEQTEARSRELQQALSEIKTQKEELEQIAKQERTLTQIIECIRQTLDIRQIFETTTSVVRQVLNADRVVIFRFAPDGMTGEFVAENVAPEFDPILETHHPHLCFARQYANTGTKSQILAIDDLKLRGLSLTQKELLSTFKVQSCLTIPLLQRQELWGLLCIHQCCATRQWESPEIEFTSRIASQLSVALQQAELLDQAQSRSLALQDALGEVKAQKEKLSRIALQEHTISYLIRRIRRTLDMDNTFRVTTQEVRNIFKCDRVVVYKFFPDWSGKFICETTDDRWRPLSQFNTQTIWKDTYLQEHQGGRFQELEASVVPDIYRQNYPDCYVKLLELFQIRAYLLVPIFKGNMLWGLLGTYQNTVRRNWTPGELRLLEQVADQLGIALQQDELLQQLKWAKDRADTANESKSSFLASMSHELRTPLNAILGFSQLMARDTQATLEQRKTLDIINRSGAHLLGLINDVLEMSKIEAGKTTLNLQDFDLHLLLQSLQEMLSLKAQSKGLDLVFECSAAVPQHINTDEGKLRQILINLLNNALKFTEKGQVALSVRGESQTTTQSQTLLKLTFVVEDTGAGISEPDLRTIFDAFTQTDVGQKSAEGTGLGLTISRHFVNLMGGEIQIRSQLGKGTTVEFDIPVVPLTLRESSLPAAQRVVGIVPGQAHHRILVVEDHLENRQFLVQLLEGIGLEVRAVENGADAIAQWQEWHPHLIWLDWHASIINGADVTRKIRALESLHQSKDLHDPAVATAARTQTIIIAVTANVFEDIHAEIIQAGAEHFIRKPFPESEIFDLMATYLQIQYLLTLLNCVFSGEQVQDSDKLEDIQL